MSTVSISRNAPCPCGSGRKHKRCCRGREEGIAVDAAVVDAVGRRLQDWAAKQFHDELGMALDLYAGHQRVLYHDDLMLFSTWFHNDRQLADGATPAQRYAARADLPPAERDAATRIATAQLGIYRVVSVDAGRSLLLEGLADGIRIEVRSPIVSRDAICWDILLAHVMDGDPPSLWGPARFFEPCDEPELRAELQRLAGTSAEQIDGSDMAAACRRHALELMQFTPARIGATRSLFTLEGDRVAIASATWRVHDLPAVSEQLAMLGGLLPDDPVELEITVTRASLVEQRSVLPPGAVIVEASHIDAPDTVPIATLRLEGEELTAEAISEPRLDYAIDVVAADLGLLVEFVERTVDDALGAPDEEMDEASPAFPGTLDDDEGRLLRDLATDRMLRWLDEPHPLLAGRTPREAVAGPGRSEVVRLIRQLENRAERAGRRGEPAADVTQLRQELRLDDEIAA
jgi:hypothetical protein